MNAISPITFATAYRQLQPAERAYVDLFLDTAEQAAMKQGGSVMSAAQALVTQPAMVEASRGMLARPMVQAAISERVQDADRSLNITMHKLIRELQHIAFASMDDYFEVDPFGTTVLALQKATPAQRSAIQSVEIDIKGRGGSNTKVKLYDKQRAIETLIELYKDRDREWLEDAAKTKQNGVLDAIPANATAQNVGDLYARMIADG